jgi:hypothetical protein
MVSDGEHSAFNLAAVLEAGPRADRETRWQWLERSAEPLAADIRTRWDRWLALLPADAQNNVISRLKARDEQQEAALAELVTFMLLRCSYGHVEVEPAAGETSRTDFAVTASEVRAHIEVNRVTQSEAARKDARRLQDVAAALERIESPDFLLALEVEVGPRSPSMRGPRRQAEEWLASLAYEPERERLEQYQHARRERMDDEMPGLGASPQERAQYFAAHSPYEPRSFERSGEDWSLRVEAIPRSRDMRGSSEITIGIRAAGEVHMATPKLLQQAVDGKLKQHRGLKEPLVIVLDLSSPIISEDEIVAALYGPMLRFDETDGVPGTRRDRRQGIWPEAPMPSPRPAAVLILRGIWNAVREATAELWLPVGADSPLVPGPWSVRTLGSDEQPLLVAPATKTVADCLD